MDVIQLEKDLTSWVAGKLDLTVDSEIFRGGVPSDKDTAVGVMLNSELKEVYPSTYNFTAQVLGKYNDRDDAWRMLHSLSSVVPCYGERVNNNIFVSIIPRGSGEPYPAEDNGKEKTFASFNLLVSAISADT